MEAYQPQVANVVAFVARPRNTAYFTPLDRIDISTWPERARFAGYDRMVIHEREAFDSPEIGNFLCVYRAGEPWARWGFARKGSGVIAWCCITGADIGQFSSLSRAFDTVFRGRETAFVSSVSMPDRVTTLVPRRRRVGTAA